MNTAGRTADKEEGHRSPGGREEGKQGERKQLRHLSAAFRPKVNNSVDATGEECPPEKGEAKVCHVALPGIENADT